MSSSLAALTITSEKGKRAERWKPSVLRSSRSARGRVDRKKVGELAAEQLMGFAAEIVRELLRDVGKRRLGIGLPEPAAAAVFELLDEVERFARFGVEIEPFGDRPR